MSDRQPNQIVRSRRAKGQGSRKASFQISSTVLQAVDSVVRSGRFRSRNALLEEALREKLRELRRERLYASYDEAASNPMFLAELQATSQAFEGAMADGLDLAPLDGLHRDC
jgi:Arc/MetJ-type ribon-helix-helix transcriptional regulator